VLATLGYTVQMDVEVAVGYGSDGNPAFWLGTFDGVGPNREVHVAFQARDAAAVRAFFDAAVGMGAEVLHEPRLCPEYHPSYYGAFVRDTERNNIEAVCHTAGPDD
jgi:catechol 2,3-dioxygenase-like lactoylglutathione lyase family enzyme